MQKYVSLHQRLAYADINHWYVQALVTELNFLVRLAKNYKQLQKHITEKARCTTCRKNGWILHIEIEYYRVSKGG